MSAVSRDRVRMAASAALLATGSAAPVAPLPAAVLIAVGAAAALLTAAGRLTRIGRSRAGIVWSALPLVEAAVVPRLGLHGAIPVVVGACFLVWGAIGTMRLLATHASDREPEPVVVADKRIRRGSELE